MKVSDNEETIKNMKTLIFGNAGVGKTSLMKSTCEGYSFLQLINIPPTKGISRENYLFRGLLEINLWDSGGQDKYLKRYFSDDQSEKLFTEVDIPIFMEDSSELHPEQNKLFLQFVEYINRFSPDAKKIYVLMNKTDLDEADPDKLFELMNIGLKTYKKKEINFTPVSVKEGSAQFRLIEILDYHLQNSALELEKMNKIRGILESMKKEIQCDLILINRPDGLITTSTLGNFKTEPFKFIPLDTGIIESNISMIFSDIQRERTATSKGLKLSYWVFETLNEYVILRDIEDFATMLIIIPEKNSERLGELHKKFNNSWLNYKKLKQLIKHH